MQREKEIVCQIVFQFEIWEGVTLYGKVCIRAKWPMKPEPIPVSVA